MSVKHHGRRVSVKGQPKRKRYQTRLLKAKNIKGWTPSGWNAADAVPCGKLAHPTREAARALTSFAQRVYRCADCSAWHITSFNPTEGECT